MAILLAAAALSLSAPVNRHVGARSPDESGMVDSAVAHPFTWTLAAGGQQIHYRGDSPLTVMPGTHWQAQSSASQAVVVVDSAGPHLHLVPGPVDSVHLIVQLEGAPLAADQARLDRVVGSAQRAAGLHRAQAGVLHDLAARGIALHVRHRYVHIFNGLAVTARAEDRQAIVETAGVRAVYSDDVLHPLLAQSVPLIGAPVVWSEHDTGGRPVTGSGVRVAIIDSGIDYTHPDLGGPGFPNARIIGGYDLVSDTIEPWDDMGHGTHVAGIVGASGQITGVAPATSLMAYKVVDAQLGYARTSDTIAAIEQALDPDGDPGTADGVQVINISLGNPGSAGDALSQACDNAAAAGVVVVAAAGNSGPYYQSLTSPGLASQVISVGATDKTDQLWIHSSRGPVPASWAIKPDLVAPGVLISSTIPGGYAYGTGTSAAAPHVAGAAALLRQMHPPWPPAWVRAALMNTAQDLGRSPFEQGAGRLRVDRAAATPALILPPSLSLGRVDGDRPVWSRQETLAIYNVSTTTVTYTLSITGSFPAGTILVVTPTQIAVAPDSAVSATFAVTVDTALVPDRTTAPFAYWGALRAVPASPLTALRVPFAFVKAPQLRLHVDELPISVMFIHDEPLTLYYAWPVTTTSDHLLPPATYSVVVQYQQPYAYIVQTAILPDSGFVEVTVPRSAATHRARIAFTDEAGGAAAPNHALHRFMWNGNGWLVSELASSEPIPEVMYFSDVPHQFVWERTVADADPGGSTYRQWHGRAEGITGDLEFLTAPADLARVDHPLRAPLGTNAYTWQEMIGYEGARYTLWFGPMATTVTLPYVRRAYYRTPPPGHDLYTLRLAVPEPASDIQEGALMSPWLQLDADRRLAWRQPFSPAAFYWRVPAGGAEPLGLGPAHWFARLEIDTPDTLRLLAAEGESLFCRAYQGGDVSRALQQPYRLEQGGIVVQAGDIGSSTGQSQAFISLPAPGAYSLVLPFTYTLGGTQPVMGQGRAIAEFDTTRYVSDANPPIVKVLRLLHNNQPTDEVSGQVELRLVVVDAVDPSPSVSVAYDVGGGWVPVAVTQVGTTYTATLPSFQAGINPNMRIVAGDASGNTLIHYLEPAYLVHRQRVYLPLLFKTAPP